jgi:hypothetical protein
MPVPFPRRYRVAAVALLLVVVTAAGRLVDFRRLTGGVKGDEATYIAMALSLAYDHDLVYQARDLERFRRMVGQDPEGIFLKRRSRLGVTPNAGWPPVKVTRTPVPVTQSLSFAKALAYPIAAAPFVAIGGVGGMLVFNAVLLLICVWCAVRYAQARTGRVTGAVMGVAFIAASVVPVYGAWLTSEMFNFAAVLVAYFLWLYKRVAGVDRPGWLERPATDWLSAVLLGVATYSKLTNALLIAPLVVEAAWRWRPKHLGAIVLCFVLGTAGLFGLNGLTSGEWNYQGSAEPGGRRTFYAAATGFPFDRAGSRFDRGSLMETNNADTETVFAPSVLALLPRNAGYLLAGRDAGLIPYYLPGVVLGLAWLFAIRRTTVWQTAIALTCAASLLALLVFAPWTWNGAGGPPGNRYVLSLYPPLLFLLPAELPWWPVALAGAGGAAFVGAMVLHPFQASATPWRNVERVPLRWLPIELTLIDDLPVRLDPLRSRILFVHDPTVFLYYMDDHTYYAEKRGFWIAGAAGTDIVVRAEQPLTRLALTLGSAVDNRVSVDFGGRSAQTSVEAGGRAYLQLTPRSTVRYHGSYAYVLHLHTTNGFVPARRDPASSDTRNLGVFVAPLFMYGNPPVALGQELPPSGGG